MTPKIMTSQEGLTAAEIGQGRECLERARDRVIAATAGLSEAQWGHRPASGGWSAAEIVEHMVVVQELVLGPIAHALDAAEETPAADPDVIDAIVLTRLPDRSRRFPAPEPAQPGGRWTAAESLQRLSANTARLVGRLETAPGLRRRRVPAPPLRAITGGEHQWMDGYQWILAVAMHTDRHTEQIREVKSEPGFPAS